MNGTTAVKYWLLCNIIILNLPAGTKYVMILLAKFFPGVVMSLVGSCLSFLQANSKAVMYANTSAPNNISTQWAYMNLTRFYTIWASKKKNTRFIFLTK